VTPLKTYLKSTACAVLAMTFVLDAGAAFAQAAPAAPAAPAPAAASPPTGRQLAEGVAAIVNDEIISTYDVRQRMLLLILTAGVQPTEQNLPQIQQQAVRSLIEERLQMQEVRRQEQKQKFEIVPTEAEVDQQIEGLAQENRITGDQLKGQLAGAGVNPETLRSQIRTQIAWQRWMQGRYGSRIRIGRDQVDAQLKRIEATSSQPRYLIGEIFIDNARAGGAAEAQRGAEQLIAQMQQGAPFSAVARQFSSAPTAANGGDAGWVSSAETPREVAAVLEQLRPGTLSPPIPAADGVYIVFLREKQAGGGASLIHLKQAAVRLGSDATPEQVAAAGRLLEQVRAKTTSCADLEAATKTVSGVTAGDLGEANEAELAPAFREAATGLTDNQLSPPIRTSVGLHLVQVCGRRSASAATPTAQEVENRLYSQQLAMLSRRYLRDLRNSATIETR
jgi:peptidyl-prolyl cis-trans isomerase SurA